VSNPPTPNRSDQRLDQRLNPKELDGVIAEIQRISQQREGTVTIDQAREILQELNLPDELLEEAVLQVKRRQAVAAQSRINLIVVLGACLLLIFGIGGNLWLQRQQSQRLAQPTPSRVEPQPTPSAAGAPVAAQDSQVFLTANPNQPVTAVPRSSEALYQVTLGNAPLGQRLDMGCDWQNPQGQVVHRNRYQTKEITKAVWPTRCKYTIGAGAPTGSWQVTMYAQGRAIAQTSFTVK